MKRVSSPRSRSGARRVSAVAAVALIDQPAAHPLRVAPRASRGRKSARRRLRAMKIEAKSVARAVPSGTRLPLAVLSKEPRPHRRPGAPSLTGSERSHRPNDRFVSAAPTASPRASRPWACTRSMKPILRAGRRGHQRAPLGHVSASWSPRPCPQASCLRHRHPPTSGSWASEEAKTREAHCVRRESQRIAKGHVCVADDADEPGIRKFRGVQCSREDSATPRRHRMVAAQLTSTGRHRA